MEAKTSHDTSAESSDNGAETVPVDAAAVESTQDTQVDTERFWAILDRLVPDGQAKVQDADGHVYDIPTSLPFRKQIKVLRKLQTLAESKSADADFDAAKQGFMQGDLAVALRHSLNFLGDDTVAQTIDEAFALAFPKVIALSRDRSDEDDAHKLGACDLFAGEEVIGALAPFLARMARSALDIAQVAPAEA